jgi:hypothetical protein
MGHTIQFNDGPDALGIEIAMGPAPIDATTQSIKIDGQQMQIAINSLTGQVQITGMVGVTIKSEAQIAIAAPTISIGDETTMSLTLAGTSLSFGGPGGAPAGSIAISGASVSLGPG